MTITNLAVFPIGILVSALVAMSGCNSSGGNGEENSQAQAIDGYIVGASVFCDGVENGGTKAAGRLECPADTNLIRIRGGSDVGFNAEASSGGIPFNGELMAPGSLSYLTPVTSVAVAMSTKDGKFYSSKFAESVEQLRTALGLDKIDVYADAANDLATVKLNAQIHQIIAGFSPTADAYAEVVREFAELSRQMAQAGARLNLTEYVSSTLISLNQRLQQAGSDLVLTESQLQSLSSETQAVNLEIEAASGIEQVALGAAKGAGAESVLAIDREASSIAFSTYSYSTWGIRSYSINAFELDALISNNQYAVVVDPELTRMYLYSRAFTVRKTLQDANVSLGLELVSTDPGDNRKLSVTTNNATLSMIADNPESMSIAFPATSKLHARAVDSLGIISDAVLSIDGTKVFQSVNGDIGIDIYSLSRELRSQGLDDITRSSGNFRLTLVIGGVKVDLVDKNGAVRANTYTVESGKGVVTGSGVRGYMTVVD